MANTKYQAKWNDKVVAEATDSEILMIEGNVYFPKTAIKQEYFVDSATHTNCPWKGEASYYTLKVGDDENVDAAWYYSEPKAGSTDVVSNQNSGRNNGDFTNYVAFWRGVKVESI